MDKRIGYFGDENSYTYACTIEHFRGSDMEGFSTIRSAIDAVEKGIVDCAIVPIENGAGGTVVETLVALKKHNVFITAQYFLPISHSLIAIAGADKHEIKRIYSHYQSLSQCEKYLQREFPNARIILSPSTTEALRMIKQRDEVAIARLPLPGQTVLESGIEDEKNNFARFIQVERQSIGGGAMASIMFDTPNSPGQLLQVLDVVKKYEINMKKIESHFAREEKNSYWFYVELDDCHSEEVLKELETELSSVTGFIKLLGTY